MKPRLYLLFLILFVLAGNHLKAQETWQHINDMPCEETSSIIQDHNGYIWIGTRLGLVRYDGYNVQIYRNDMANPHAFSSCNIVCLTTDGADNIFAGSFFGLNTLYMPTRSITSTHFDGEDFVKAVFYDSRGRLWIGTDNGLYVKRTQQNPQQDTQPHPRQASLHDGQTDKVFFNPIPHDRILHINETPRGDIIVVSQNNGIFTIDEKDNCTAIDGTAALRPRTTFADKAETLWIGTERNGLYSINSGTIKRHEGYDSYIINDIEYNTQRNAMLLATNKGISQYPTPSLTLADKNVVCLYRDNDGNVWASTEGHGTYIQRNYKMPFKNMSRAFTRQTTPIISQFDVSHLADTVLWESITNINAIHESSDGTTFVGTWGDGLYITKHGNIISHLTQANTPWLNDNFIYSICTLPDYSALIATWHGFYLMDSNLRGGYVEQIGTSDISNMHILSIYSAAPHDVWMGLVGGIAHIKGDLHHPTNATITIYTHVNNKGIHNPDNAGALTDRHDGEGEYQLGGIYRIIKDRHGRIWACTSEPGLLLYDAANDAFRSVSKDMGILGDNVHSMDISPDGTFWMTTNYGILQMNIDTKGKVSHRQLYTQHDGLPTTYYGSTMTTLLADGNVCFLNQDNLITIRQKDLPHADRTATRTFISNILVNGTPLTYNTNSTATLPPYAKHITLSHDQNSIAIYFTTLSFGQEPSIRYSYKLDGIDTDFCHTDMGNNSITYSHLAPGTYTLHYCVLDNAANPTDMPQTLTIEILQPLWWRWWAKTLYTIVLLLIIYVITHSAIDRSRKKQQLKILEIEKRQLDELYKQKTQFYVKALHEFLTPLTLMNEMIHNLQNQVRPSLQASIFMLVNHADRLMQAMSNIVNAKEDTSAQDALHKAKEMTQIDRDFLHRCTESVNRHIADAEYSHKTMMEEVGASHATLYRKLKALTGMDTTSFIRSIRMRAACQIMAQEPQIRINELAERVGYDNPKYFSTCFKNEFGITPSKYQQGEKE